MFEFYFEVNGLSDVRIVKKLPALLQQHPVFGLLLKKHFRGKTSKLFEIFYEVALIGIAGFMA